MADDLFVCDVDYDLYACKIEDYWQVEDEILQELISTLSKVEKHGIAQGDAHDSILIIKEAIEINYNNSKDQGSIIMSNTLDFLERIDEIDLKLYGG